MSKISVEEMLDSAMHFGHQTFRRNPKMDKYIFGTKSGIHIIDLTKTEPLFNKALDFVSTVAAEGKQMIFVGAKRQASEIIAENAKKAGMPYVNERWLGGLLTNFETIKTRLKYLRDLDEKYAANDFSDMTKKEKVVLDAEYKILEHSLGGLRDLKGVPAAIFVVDVLKDHIAVKEAQKLGIPVVGIVDTNVNPDLVNYPIPANDDAKKSIDYVVTKIAEACMSGAKVTSKKVEEKVEVKTEDDTNKEEVAKEEA